MVGHESDRAAALGVEGLRAVFDHSSDAVVFTLTYAMVLHAQGIRVLRVLSLLRRQRPVAAPVLPAQPDPGEAAEASVL